MTELSRVLSLLALSAALTTAAAAPPDRPWQNPALDADRRADLLNAQLTIDERIALVHGPMAMPFKIDHIPAGAIGSAGYIPGVARLGIPALQESDASLGVTNPMQMRPGDGATALPSGVALAATFDRRLAFESGALIGGEARAKGFNVLLAGGSNLIRDPRNGRNFEYLSEDPLLTGALAGESIAGIQSRHVVSTIKHFALNAQESNRLWANAMIGEAAFRESDLLAFQLAIERGRPGSVMCAYNLVNGEKACGNHHLLTDVLKRDWKYPGWVMSDWGAVEGVEFAAAGLDQQSGEQLDRQIWFGAPLKAAVEGGLIPAARVADMTHRILRSMFAAGLFDAMPAKQPIDYAANAAVARGVASDAIVLLRNERGRLPLAATAKNIVVIGGHADMGVLSGGGSSQVSPPGGAKKVIPLGGGGMMAAWRNMTFQSGSIVDAIKARAKDATVTYDDGRYPERAAALAKAADVVILVANQWTTEGEDVPDLSLPNGQDALIAAVVRANPDVVVVLQTGGPVLMPWLDQTAAILEAWYSGAGGADAIADVLFGVVNPAGRLPVTFPASIDQYPRVALPGADLPEGKTFEVPYPEGSDVGYRRFAAKDMKPLFPFGYGLSYTRFGYANPRLIGGKTISVTFDVTNLGERAGKEAVQVYLTRAANKARKRLIAFDKVALDPGQTRTVSLTADPRLLADFDVRAGQWRVVGGDYQVAIGGSSAAAELRGSVRLVPSTVQP